jgi:hypothetical protein
MAKEGLVQRQRDEHGCAGDCAAIVAERNLYFTGKFMTARDFAADSEYLLGRHRLHNRLLHGWGIVCGLRVKRHPRPECRNEWVVVRAGVAIDCCGRELVLAGSTPFRLPFASNGKAAHGYGAGELEAEHERRERCEEHLLCIRYCEEAVEHVPALYHESCDPARTHANRVRETARLELMRLDDAGPGCWRSRNGEPCSRDDCDDEHPGRGGGCLEPDCPCGSCVPLALVRFDPGRPDRGFELDTSGRRTLPPSPDYLTHVCRIGWPHGGEVSVDELACGDVRIEIGFDRPLLDEDSEAVGVNEHTFQVTYGSAQEDLEFLPFSRPPYADGDRAVYEVDRAYVSRGGRRSIAGSVVYVTLKCNFVRDCHENPIDGDHLGALLPSGDGVPGGTFESWFRVVHEQYSPSEPTPSYRQQGAV